MVKLTWKFNGRTVPANREADELTKAVRANVGDAAKDTIARVRCPVHATAQHPPQRQRRRFSFRVRLLLRAAAAGRQRSLPVAA